MNTSRQLTIRTAARLLDSGLVSSSQLSLFCHSMATAGEEIWGLNAYNIIVPWQVISERALESDGRRRYDDALSIFDGIPISIKSNIADKTLPLTAGSFILGFGNNNKDTRTPPCGYDADTVRILLREKGGIMMGTTSMDEFGMGSLGTNSRHPDGSPRHVKNPLPFLKHLNLNNDNKYNADDVPIRNERTRSDDERLAKIILQPPELIFEKHQKAMESLRKEEEESSSSSSGNNFHYHYSAGGSSCGSAASVAHGSSLLSLGTDTGGSVRLPAAWCGLVGLKPSYGLLSRHGVVSYASSFDTVGILAKSVDCASTALDILAQRDVDYSRDSTFSSYGTMNNYSEIAIAQTIMSSSSSLSLEEEKEPKEALSGIRVGIPAAFSVEECPNEIRDSWSRAADWLNENGADVIEISTNDISPGLIQRALSAYYILVSAEASSNLSRYDGFRYGVTADAEEKEGGVVTAPDNNGAASNLTPLERQYSATRRQGFGTEVTRRVLCGASVLSSDKFHTHYEAAAQIRAHLAEEINAVLDGTVDIILIPTVLSLPHKIAQNNDINYIVEDSTAMFANDIMTVPASLAGLPAISIPVPIEGEKTFFGGMQLISSRLGESTLMRSAKILEQIIN
jgi:aspartyl-tRNA(Asn)/glutamyl-tRNA(Gln) amidotransferase subunit A